MADADQTFLPLECHGYRAYRATWIPDCATQALAREQEAYESSRALIKLAQQDRLDINLNKRKPTQGQVEVPQQQHSKKRPRNGPCAWGHQHTSGVDNRRRPRWSTNPRPSPWTHIPSGATLCQKCYQLAIRHRRQGTTTPIPATPRGGCTTPCTIPQTPVHRIPGTPTCLGSQSSSHIFHSTFSHPTGRPPDTVM